MDKNAMSINRSRKLPRYLTIALLTLLLFVSTGCSSKEPEPVVIRREAPFASGRKAPLTDTSCRRSSDCATVVELWPSCRYYCQGEECGSRVEECQVFNRGSAPAQDFPCLRREPCRKPEGEIVCFLNRCRVMTPKDK